jgi:oxygen-dependent protoporphyrinogen oxidase
LHFHQLLSVDAATLGLTDSSEMTAAAKDDDFGSKQSKNVAVIGAGVRYHLFLDFWFLGFLSVV